MAEVHDRMHLKTTHYAYAKHAEALGEYPAAISRLERDGCVYCGALYLLIVLVARFLVLVASFLVPVASFLVPQKIYTTTCMCTPL